MIKCCIFDLDGTLLNTLDDLAASCNYALQKFGFKTFVVEEYRYFVGNGVNKLIERTMPSAATQAERLLVREAFAEHYANHFLDLTVPYEGVENLLRMLKLKNIKTCVVTNKPHNFSKELLVKIFGEKFFDIIIGATDELPKKPAPEGVLLCMQKLGAKAEECVYIGDSDVDIQTAQNAGIRSIGVEWGFRGRAELLAAGADYIVISPKNIITTIEKF